MDAPKLVEGREMFKETSLTSVDLTLNAASLDSLWMMCCDSPNLEYVKLQGDVPNLRTINQLFRGCPNLKTIDLSQFRATSLVDMASMARGCGSLTQVDLAVSRPTSSKILIWRSRDVRNWRPSIFLVSTR